MADDRLKRMAAEGALEHLGDGGMIGVGTGSTTNLFIDALAGIKSRFDGAVASSAVTAARLEAHGIKVFDFAAMDRIPVYVDGADECDPGLRLIKGGGGALTREKIIAAAAERFVCIVDESKQVEKLGAFPLPVEVVPSAAGYVTRELSALGGRPVQRAGFVSDNGNPILDVHDLDIPDPAELESRIDGIAGVVANGLFARRPADLLLVGTPSGLRTLTC